MLCVICRWTFCRHYNNLKSVAIKTCTNLTKVAYRSFCRAAHLRQNKKQLMGCRICIQGGWLPSRPLYICNTFQWCSVQVYLAFARIINSPYSYLTAYWSDYVRSPTCECTTVTLREHHQLARSYPPAFLSLSLPFISSPFPLSDLIWSNRIVLFTIGTQHVYVDFSCDRGTNADRLVDVDGAEPQWSGGNGDRLRCYYITNRAIACSLRDRDAVRL